MVFSAATWSPSNPRPGVAPTLPFCQVHSIVSRLFGSRRSPPEAPDVDAAQDAGLRASVIR